MKTKPALLLLAVTLSSTVHSAGCPYAAQAGHCCNGSIYRSQPSGNLNDPSTWTCCQGANPSMPNSQGTCPSGNAISLADAPTVDGSGGSGSSISSSATTSASVAAPNTSSTTSAEASSTSTGGSASSTPSASPAAQNYTNAANGLMMNGPLVVGALIAGGVALAL